MAKTKQMVVELNLDTDAFSKQRQWLDRQKPAEEREGLISLLDWIADVVLYGDQDKQPVFTIVVEGGCVADVEDLPEGISYRIDDRDVEGDETEEEYNARIAESDDAASRDAT